MNQLLCAAVVNDRFRQTLLRDPVRALSGGYLDRNFALTSEERDMVIGIQAQHLEDFASQVYHWVSGNGNGHNGNGNGNGNGHDPQDTTGSLVDLYRTGAPVPA